MPVSNRSIPVMLDLNYIIPIRIIANPNPQIKKCFSFSYFLPVWLAGGVGLGRFFPPFGCVCCPLSSRIAIETILSSPIR
jgi:hypothetical protein